MYDLRVQVASWPHDLDARWVALLAMVDVHVDPEVGVLEHQGRWFPLAVYFGDDFALASPVAWVEPGVDTGFELEVDSKGATLHAPFSETAAAWLCASALAVAAGGQLTDFQTGATFSGDDLATVLSTVWDSRWPPERPAPTVALSRSVVTFGGERREPGHELVARREAEQQERDDALVRMVAEHAPGGASVEVLLTSILDGAEDDAGLHRLNLEWALERLRQAGVVVQRGSVYYLP
jgi:hypothetical protein